MSEPPAAPKRDDVFWPPHDEAEEHLYEIRNGVNADYVAAHVLALKELWTARAPVTEGAREEMTGRIAGTVTDFRGDPLARVRVTVRSPVMMGQSEAVTNRKGDYDFNFLPPGIYAMTFVRHGFLPIHRRDVELTVGFTVTVGVRWPSVTESPAEGAPPLDESEVWFRNLNDALRRFVQMQASRDSRHHLIAAIDEAIRRLRLGGHKPADSLSRSPAVGSEGASQVERWKRFNDTTACLTGGNAHPDRCVCQEKEKGQYADTPHKHYAEAPHSCARCGCSAYQPAIPDAGGTARQEPPATIEARISNYLNVGGLFNPERMEHEKVRDLLMDCRAENSALRAQLDKSKYDYERLLGQWDVMARAVGNYRSFASEPHPDIEERDWLHAARACVALKHAEAERDTVKGALAALIAGLQQAERHTLADWDLQVSDGDFVRASDVAAEIAKAQEEK